MAMYAFEYVIEILSSNVYSSTEKYLGFKFDIATGKKTRTQI